MALIYPVLADAPEPDDDAAPDFAELEADLSDQWLVEVAVSEDGDDGCFGPLTAREAWDLAIEMTRSEGLCPRCPYRMGTNLRCPTCFTESSPALGAVAPLAEVLASVDTRLSRENGRIDVYAGNSSTAELTKSFKVTR